MGVHTYIYTQTHTHIYMYIYMYVCIYIYIYMHIYIYMYMCTYMWGSLPGMMVTTPVTGAVCDTARCRFLSSVDSQCSNASSDSSTGVLASVSCPSTSAQFTTHAYTFSHARHAHRLTRYRN